MATSAIAAAIAAQCRAGDLLVLAGEMGAGKTAFAQGFGAALGVTDPITSPTFTLVHTYDTPTVAPNFDGTLNPTKPLTIKDRPVTLVEAVEENPVDPQDHKK